MMIDETQSRVGSAHRLESNHDLGRLNRVCEKISSGTGVFGCPIKPINRLEAVCRQNAGTARCDGIDERTIAVVVEIGEFGHLSARPFNVSMIIESPKPAQDLLLRSTDEASNLLGREKAKTRK